MNQTVVRFIAEGLGLDQFRRVKRVVSLALKLGVLGALGVGFAYLLLGEFIATTLFNVPILTTVTALVAAWLMVSVLQILLGEILRGFQDIRLATIFGSMLLGGGLATGVLLFVVLSLIWLEQGQTTLSTVLLIVVGSSFLIVMFAAWTVRRKLNSLPNRANDQNQIKFRELWDVAWPLLITNLTLFIVSQAGLWILGVFRTSEDIAVYGAATRLVLLVSLPLAIVNAIVPPFIAEMNAQGKKREMEQKIRALTTLAGIPAFAALAGFIFLGGATLDLVFGDYYRNGAAILAILSIGYMANVWTGSCGMVLAMTGYQKAVMSVAIVASIVTVLVGIATVVPFGAVGVAVATSLGLILQNTVMWLVAKSKVGVWTHPGFEGILGKRRTPKQTSAL